jgi:hypothetical protein
VRTPTKLDDHMYECRGLMMAVESFLVISHIIFIGLLSFHRPDLIKDLFNMKLKCVTRAFSWKTYGEIAVVNIIFFVLYFIRLPLSKKICGW